jgi:hypothetical protein
MGIDGAIILDILNFIGRFFNFGMETKQFPKSFIPGSRNGGARVLIANTFWVQDWVQLKKEKRPPSFL